MTKANTKITLIGFSIIAAGFVLLLGAMSFSKNVFKRTNAEISVINQFIDQIDKNFSHPMACQKTIGRKFKSYSPRELSNVKTSTGAVEFSIGNKVTNNYLFSKLTTQLVEKSDPNRILLLNFVFENLQTQSKYKLLKTLSVTVSKNKITNCKLMSELRI